MGKLVNVFEGVMGARESYFRALKESEAYDPHGYLENVCTEALEYYEDAIENLLNVIPQSEKDR